MHAVNPWLLRSFIFLIFKGSESSGHKVVVRWSENFSNTEMVLKISKILHENPDRSIYLSSDKVKDFVRVHCFFSILEYNIRFLVCGLIWITMNSAICLPFLSLSRSYDNSTASSWCDHHILCLSDLSQTNLAIKFQELFTKNFPLPKVTRLEANIHQSIYTRNLQTKLVVHSFCAIEVMIN